MVRLKNIAIKDAVIECDIYPEDSAQAGRVSVDMESKKLILQEPCRTRKR